MHKLRRIVLGAAAALLVNAGTAAAAPPDFTAAKQLCAGQGGEILREGADIYTCRLLRPVDPDRADRAAMQLCESAYRGTFGFSQTIYQCEGIPER